MKYRDLYKNIRFANKRARTVHSRQNAAFLCVEGKAVSVKERPLSEDTEPDRSDCKMHAPCCLSGTLPAQVVVLQ